MYTEFVFGIVLNLSIVPCRRKSAIPYGRTVLNYGSTVPWFWSVDHFSSGCVVKVMNQNCGLVAQNLVGRVAKLVLHVHVLVNLVLGTSRSTTSHPRLKHLVKTEHLGMPVESRNRPADFLYFLRYW